MSEITETIRRYTSGEIPFEDVVDVIARFPFEIPPRKLTPPVNRYENVGDCDDYPAERTFDEVTAAWDRRQLTWDEYRVLSDVHREAQRDDDDP